MKFILVIILALCSVALFTLYEGYKQAVSEEMHLRFNHCLQTSVPSDTARCHCAKTAKLPELCDSTIINH